MRWGLCCLVLCACRIGFDARGDDADVGDGPLGTDALTCAGRAIPVPSDGAISGSIAPATGDDHGTCGGDGVRELVYSIDVTVPGSGLVAGADHPPVNTDTLMYIRSDCADPSTEIVCDPDSGIAEAPDYLLPTIPIGRYFVYIDGQTDTTGDFTGAIQVLLPQGATCDPTAPRSRCAPDLDCIAGTCMPAGCTIQEVLTGANSYDRVVSTTGAQDLHGGSCGTGQDGGVRAPELVYQLHLASAVTNVHVSTNTSMTDFDTLIYVRDACAGTEIACNDDAQTSSSNQSELDTGALAAGDYFIFLDGFSVLSGNAELVVTVTP